MSSKITAAVLSLALVSFLGTTSFAQQGKIKKAVSQQSKRMLQAGAPQQRFVQPPGQVQVVQQNRYYFGVNVVLTRDNWGQATLRIVSVTPGSPAQRAGLECGDEIRTVNGRNFKYARDSFDAVRLMNQFVDAYVAPLPAPATGQPAVAFVQPSPRPQPRAQMMVRNVRNGQNVVVTVIPQRRFGNGGVAPAAIAGG